MEVLGDGTRSRDDPSSSSADNVLSYHDTVTIELLVLGQVIHLSGREEMLPSPARHAVTVMIINDKGKCLILGETCLLTSKNRWVPCGMRIAVVDGPHIETIQQPLWSVFGRGSRCFCVHWSVIVFKRDGYLRHRPRVATIACFDSVRPGSEVWKTLRLTLDLL